VAVALVAGGVAILWAERRPVHVKAERAEQISRLDALKIGFVQCLALWPGTSRSGATIIGGLWFGASRQAATEFSFFLGIPILGAASVYNLFKHWGALSSDDIGVFAMGFFASFAFALLAIRLLMRYLAGHGFGVFAWYRIALGTLILMAIAT
jgi:undecaprenyl-diphosphatase